MAWGAVAGRSAELAAALGGRSLCCFPPGPARPPVAVRWARAAVATVADVRRHRPAAVIVTNPPMPAAVVAWLAGRSVGARVLLDSHPGGFGAQGDRVAARLQWVHRWLVRRVDGSLVAERKWQRVVEGWGGSAMVLHEAPGDWTMTVPRRHDPLRVLYVGRFAADEPWREVLGAAASLRAGGARCEVQMTGDPGRAGLSGGSVPGNVTLLGYLDPANYARAVREADVVVTLTTEPGSVMRAACEAVWAGRPLVVSDWPAARELFPHAVHVANDAAGLAAGIRLVDAGYDRLAAAAPAARAAQEARWEAQLAELRERLGVEARCGEWA
ncbi:MAG TPA: glycosyltransferase [Acidimicrobiales bacterium]|nr:glycosyltransferase [Acidimicrobiales bacterium]